MPRLCASSVPRFDSTSQALSPQAADTLLLTPLLDHPSLELFVLHLHKQLASLLLLPTFLRRHVPADDNAQTLHIQPSREVLEHDGVVQQDLLVPGRTTGGVVGAWGRFDGSCDSWEEVLQYSGPFW